jgi:HAE1 family hydrophobic/amphiphilic exporter-1
MILKPHTGHVKKWGLLAFFLHLFDRGVENVKGGYAGVLRRIVTFRTLTSLVIVGFGGGIYFVNNHFPSGLTPLEDQGMIYGIIPTPPGWTIE